MKQYLWLGLLLGLMVGAVWVCARAAESTVPQPLTNDPNKWLYGPEIWRLPAVDNSSTTTTPFFQPAAPGVVMPAALTVPPADAITAPKPEEDKPPCANAPASLSGVLSNGERIEDKPKAEKLWDGSFDLGLDGSEGNSEAFNFRFGLKVNRKSADHALTLSLDYNKSTAHTIASAHRLFFAGRSEWLINQSRWSWFVHETVDYNEFESYNVQDASDAGIGYRLIKNDATTLIGRIGTGFSHEYGGPENGVYVPEAVFGTQLERQISKRQKFLGAVEYAPKIGEILHYRIRAQAALEVLLDPEKNLNLRMGVLERYDSLPESNSRPSDLDYAATLMWKF